MFTGTVKVFSLCHVPLSGVDECASGLHTCHESAMCTDTVSGFVCTCREQLTGDGHTHCSPGQTSQAGLATPTAAQVRD